MKIAGLIGGMSWESTIEYYRIMNETVKEHYGGLHSAECILYSFDFESIGSLQRENEWEKLTGLMIDAATRLKKAGADFIVICTNTMHKMADDIENSVGLPLLHIADATGEAITKKGLRKVGLLGTTFTMEEDFYKKRINEKYGIDIIIPPENQRKTVHSIIFDELCVGKIDTSSKERMLEIMRGLISSGAEGIILGCTEIPLLINQDDVDFPVFDTTAIHARAAVSYALR